MPKKNKKKNFFDISLNKEISSRLKHTFVWVTVTSLFSLAASFAVYYFERTNNPNLETVPKVIWWWIVTVTGIGGATPLTREGKVLATLVIVSSIVFFAIAISEVADLIRLTYERKERGIIRINYQNHIIIFGYSSLTAGVIKLLRWHFGEELKIVLISNDTRHNPFPREVDFIYANPIDKDTFLEANVRQSIASIILANDRFSDPDAYSLVIATGVEMFNPKSVTIAEIMDDEYKDLYKQGNIEAFIKRKELLKDMLERDRDSKLIRIIEKETHLEDEIGENKEEGQKEDKKVDLI